MNNRPVFESDSLPRDGIRRARILMALPPDALDPVVRAQELRTCGRPDLALSLLGAAGPSEAKAAELQRVNEALGFARESVRPPGGFYVLVSRVFAACAILLARLVTGKKVIKFSSMDKFTRLADLVDRVDPLLRDVAAGGEADRTRVIIFFFGGYPNAKMMEMYRRHCVFIMCTNRVTRKLGNTFVAMLRAAGRHTEITTDYRKINQSFLRNPPVIAFDEADRPGLERQMRAAGIDPARPCVVFGLRDMAYYTFYGDVMKIPLTKQGRRAQTHHRCPSLASYLPFAQYWAERGFQVIRMGLRVSDVIPPGSHANIIDYAAGPRSDELDAWLFATCRFMVAGDTGLFSGAAAFDRPSVLSDLFLIQNTMYSSNKTTRNIFVPKLIRDVRENRLLSFREMIYFNHHFSFFEDCEADGFDIVHNEPEDILAATIELEERLEGKFVESSEDRELQAAYHALYPPRFRGYKSTGLVSAAFLRKHAKLLD